MTELYPWTHCKRLSRRWTWTAVAHLFCPQYPCHSSLIPPPAPLHLPAFSLLVPLHHQCSRFPRSSIQPVFLTFFFFFSVVSKLEWNPSALKLGTIRTTLSIKRFGGFMSLVSSSLTVLSKSSGSRPLDSWKGEVCSWAPSHEETGGCGSGTETHSYHW